jgi:restriction system protein
LIEGKELAKLMIENNVGIKVKNIYEIKKIDIDYFEEL